MSFRTEEKIIIHQNQLKEFKSLILKNHGTKLYPKRKICSLYFDNPVLQMFADSEEGTVPRKKIRIRNYPEAKIMSYNLEKKISSVEGRFKKTKKINELDFNEFCKHGIYDNEYGSCLPKIWVQYYREYFQLYNQRITIDYKLEYKDFNSKVFC